MVFFERRLTDEEAARLYTNYRGEEYTRVRLEIEPSYERYLALFDDPLSTDYYMIRVSDYIELVNVYPEMAEAKRILDFGGDGTVPARAFPWSTVTVDDLCAGNADQIGEKFDMIFASNVFEHLSDPVPVLRELTGRLRPDGLIFIDVPAPSHSNLAEGLLWQERYGGELYEMHEHITHFSRRSLVKLAKAAGLVPVFEYPSRYCPLSLVAMLECSALAQSLMPEKRLREIHFETRIARDEARATHNKVNLLRQHLEQQLADLSVPHATRDEARLDALREELSRVYKSTSWGVTAPMRVFGRAIRHLLGSR
ncbi:hypothetical protein BCY88_06015 [Paraburkholderia fungorum]|uniref:Class I SAM-dependent methyltransferase n=1 Tax=Paraburkholderia fungorum TaxID=134537 RepID=A0A420GEC8_9BURK|nr:hypothetical protein BCY88_06015 [Paraburkholderia fungorum]